MIFIYLLQVAAIRLRELLSSISHEDRERKVTGSFKQQIHQCPHLLPTLICLEQTPILILLLFILCIEFCTSFTVTQAFRVGVILWKILISLSYVAYTRKQVKNRLKMDKDPQYIHVALCTLSLNKDISEMDENVLQYLSIVQHSTAEAFQTSTLLGQHVCFSLRRLGKFHLLGYLILSFFAKIASKAINYHITKRE